MKTCLLNHLILDARMSDYVVDGIESPSTTGSGHYYNVTPGSGTFGPNQASSALRPNNLVSSVHTSKFLPIFPLCSIIKSAAFLKTEMRFVMSFRWS